MAELAKGITLSASLGPKLEAVFRCSFADIDGQAYSYDVYWYINDQSVVAPKRIAYSNIDQSLLRSVDWVGKYQMNMMVRICISTYMQNILENTMRRIFFNGVQIHIVGILQLQFAKQEGGPFRPHYQTHFIQILLH